MSQVDQATARKRRLRVVLRVRPPSRREVERAEERGDAAAAWTLLPQPREDDRGTHGDGSGVAASAASGGAGGEERRAAAPAHRRAVHQLDVPDEASGRGKAAVFAADEVLGPEASQAQTYSRVAWGCVETAFAGGEGSVICYGQSTSGKRTTIIGITNTGSRDPVPCRSTWEGDDWAGVFPRAIAHVMSRVAQERGKGAGDAPPHAPVVTIGALSVYNQFIRDLVCETGRGNARRSLRVRQDECGCYVPGQRFHPIDSVDDGLRVVHEALNKHARWHTMMSSRTTRATVILELRVHRCGCGLTSGGCGAAGCTPVVPKSDDHIEGIPGALGGDDWDGAACEAASCGVFRAVVLPGSDRRRATEAPTRGGRITPHALSSICRVLQALRNPSATFVPYRDAVETRLLQNALGGFGNATLVCCASPSSTEWDETRSTLRVMTVARQAPMKPLRLALPVRACMIHGFKRSGPGEASEVEEASEEEEDADDMAAGGAAGTAGAAAVYYDETTAVVMPWAARAPELAGAGDPENAEGHRAVIVATPLIDAVVDGDRSAALRQLLDGIDPAATMRGGVSVLDAIEAAMARRVPRPATTTEQRYALAWRDADLGADSTAPEDCVAVVRCFARMWRRHSLIEGDAAGLRRAVLWLCLGTACKDPQEMLSSARRIPLRIWDHILCFVWASSG